MKLSVVSGFTRRHDPNPPSIPAWEFEHEPRNGLGAPLSRASTLTLTSTKDSHAQEARHEEVRSNDQARKRRTLMA